MLLSIIRHAEVSRRNDPDSDLSETGRLQARLTGLRMATEHPTHIISSPLRRALGTAHEIALTCGVDVVDVWEEVREGFIGTFTGIDKEALLASCPRARPQPWFEDAACWTNLGDTTGSFFARCETALRRLLGEFPADAHPVVVTHGAFANWLIHRALEIPPRDDSTIWFDLANCSISQLETVKTPGANWPEWWLYPPLRLKVLRLNDTGHLSQPCQPVAPDQASYE